MSGRIFFYAVSGVCGGLGIWQTKRYYWKVDQISELQDNQGKKILIFGHYLKDHDILLGLRSAPQQQGKRIAQGLAVNPQGYYVYAPFQVLNTVTDNKLCIPAHSIIFVNRGWIPRQCNKYFTPYNSILIEGVVTIGEQDKSSNKLIWVDSNLLLDAAKLEKYKQPDHPPVILDIVQEDIAISSDNSSAITSSSNSDPPSTLLINKNSNNNNESVNNNSNNDKNEHEVIPIIKSVTTELSHYYVTPQSHVAYAITWYSLSIVSFIIGFYKFKRNPSGMVKNIIK